MTLNQRTSKYFSFTVKRNEIMTNKVLYCITKTCDRCGITCLQKPWTHGLPSGRSMSTENGPQSPSVPLRQHHLHAVSTETHLWSVQNTLYSVIKNIAVNRYSRHRQARVRPSHVLSVHHCICALNHWHRNEINIEPELQRLSAGG